MIEPGRFQGSSGSRRRKRFLSPSEKYEMWVGLLRGEYTTVQAAERAGVDRTRIMRVRQVAKQGGAGRAGGVPARGQDRRPGSRAGRGQGGDRSPVGGVEGDGCAVDAGGGKRALGLSGRVPRRVDEATKQQLLSMIDRALADGWEHRRACSYLELDEGRAWRWRRRRDAGCLEDKRSGANPVHGLRPEEITAILELFEAWGEIDRSHRKLAHRGSYLGLVWVSRPPSVGFSLHTTWFSSDPAGSCGPSAGRFPSGQSTAATRSGSTTSPTFTAAPSTPCSRSWTS